MLTLRLLHAIIFTWMPEGFWGLPTLIWGEPGTGKSALVRQATLAAALAGFRLSPGERGEGQFGVVPVPSADGKTLTYPAPVWVSQLADGGVLFLDEINTAAPMIQSALLGLVQFKQLGDHQFGPRVRILAAANDVEDAAGGFELARSVDARFCHLPYAGLPLADWAAGLVGGFAGNNAPPVDPVAEESRVMAALPAAQAKAAGIIAGFLQARPALLHVAPKSGDREHAHPNRRTWHYAAAALASAEIHGLSEAETDFLLGGLVGTSAVIELRTWLHNADLPDATAVADGRVTFTIDTVRLDRTIAVLSAAAGVVLGTPKAERKPRADRVWGLVGECSKVAVAACTGAAMALVHGGVAGPTPVLKAMSDVVVAAGINRAAA